MKKDIETRFATFELRANDDEEMVISGRAITYANPTDIAGFVEVIEPGAAAEALVDSDVVALFNHNADKPMAREGNKTLQLNESDNGLDFRAELNDTSYSRDCYEAVKRGDLKSCSFAFTVGMDGEEWTQEGGKNVRHILKFDEIFDISVVTYPAYSGTSVSARALEIVEKSKASDPEASGDDSQAREKDADMTEVFDKEISLHEKAQGGQ